MITLDMENLQRENETLRQRSAEDAAPSHDERNEVEPQNTGRTNIDDEETRKMHQNLGHLMEKYKEMSKKIGTSSFVDHLLNSTDPPFIIEIMMMSLPPKFKVPQIELYDGSKDPVEYLEMFKAHTAFHIFL